MKNKPMSENDETPYVILTTTGEKSKAEEIGKRLVEEKLTACINVIPGVTSIYRWKGYVEKSEEVLLLLKSTGKKLEELISRLEEIHPYEVPEVLAFPIERGSKGYLKWLMKCVTKNAEK